jgi:hypothetical protein
MFRPCRAVDTKTFTVDVSQFFDCDSGATLIDLRIRGNLPNPGFPYCGALSMAGFAAQKYIR